MLFKFELEGGNFSKAGYASSQIKKVLKQLAIDPRIIKRVVVALYEAEVNIVAHAWRGTVVAELDADKISLELKDEGPGIPDISIDFGEGDSIAVVAGVWKDTVGVVQKLDYGKQTATINVELFGRETPVEISFAEVRKL